MKNSVRRLGVGAVAALLTASVAVVAAPSAVAKGGEVGGSGSEYHLSDTFAAEANIKFNYGKASDQVYVGDWDGNGTDTLALRRGATFYIRNSNSGGNADQVVTYGRPGDVVLVGDWNGDGKDTFAVRRGAVYHVKNSMTGGPADTQVVYGRSNDTILVGDWDGDGDDTFAVRRGAEYHVKYSIAAGSADKVAVYGRGGDDVYVGDWNGDGTDTFTVRRGAQYFIANAIRPGNADRTVVYGRTTDTTLVGDWNGDGADSLGIRRMAAGITTPSPERGTRANPLPIGTTVVFDEWTVRLGKPREAWDEIRAENMFNDPPPAGMQYWIVPVTATYTGDETGTAWWDLTIEFVGADARTYSDDCGVLPNDLMDIDELYRGGVAEGNECVVVPAGANGLWTLEAGWFTDPVFFTAR